VTVEAETAAAPGSRIVVASWVGTAVFVVAAIAATVAPDSLGTPFAALSVIYLVVGMVLFLLALLVAAARSRTDAIGIGGLFFLQGSAPRGVQVQLMASFAVEVVVAFVAASIRIYTPLAFGLLVPMYALGLAGLWGARYGSFGPRVETPAPPAEP
jgi:hypothetical protein